jgi:sigma-E factor negative regulatory protein RseB
VKRWFFCLLLLASTGVFAQENPAEPFRPQDHLMAMSSALRQLDYKGVYAYEQGARRSSQQWVHAVRDGVEIERLLGLDGAHREIIRQRPLGCMQSSEKAIHDHLIASLSGDIGALDMNYDIDMAAPETIAGHSSVVVLIKPKDAFRFGYRMFADAETHLLLGADRLDTNGDILEKFRFLTVQIGAVKDSDLRAVTASPSRLDASRCDVPSKLPEAISPARWTLDVPAGYTLCSQEKHNQDNEQEEALMFSDGLSHFTVFIRQQVQAEQDGQMQRGNTLLRSSTVDIDGQLYALTVVGEIPEPTAKQVMNNVKLNVAQ